MFEHNKNKRLFTLPTPFVSYLCPAQFDTLATECNCLQIIYNCRKFCLCGYLDIEYFFKFAEFQHQVHIASEVTSNI